MSTYYDRWQKEPIAKALKNWRVVILSGARQCGKTTLAKSLAGNNFSYRSLDDDDSYNSAKLDPAGFVHHEDDRLIIDEVQRVPGLLRNIKKVVDEDPRPGRFLITGSANIQAMPGANESLAGRAYKVRLRPLSWGEMLSQKPDFIPAAFAQKFHHHESKLKKSDLIEIAFRGGYPEAIIADDAFRRQWHRGYIEMLLDRDLLDVANIRRRDAMRQLIEILAAWSSKYMDVSDIGRGLALQRETLDNYIQLLEALFLFEEVTPWSKTDYGRAGKQSKIFISDSGLMCSVLGWNIDDVIFDADRSGKLIETWAFNEIAAQVGSQPIDYKLYHYRDRDDREVDFLIEREDGALVGIEIKSGSNISASSFKNLRWFKETIAKKRSFVGIVLHSGSSLVPFGPNMWAVPYGALYKS